MKDKLLQAFSNLLDSLISATPKVVVGVVLAVVGWLVAKGIEAAVRYTLTRIQFDQLIARAGLQQPLERLGISQLSAVLPRTIYFLVLLVLARTASDGLGMVAISSAIGAFFAYLPNIVAAILVMVIGSAAAQVAGNTVTHAAASSGLDFAPSVGRAVSGVILFVCAMMAVGQLKIDTDIIRIFTTLVLGGAALAFGLSFGLGTRDVVRNLTAGFYARKVLTVGKAIEIAGQRGTLVAITPTHVVVESEGHQIVVANATLLDSTARQ